MNPHWLLHCLTCGWRGTVALLEAWRCPCDVDGKHRVRVRPIE